ncbi:muskelin-like [Littorina saxatilis]|uniref:Muskelin n=1 Tax=Littorina saxatilis TaxID=31220 RepID=A0AAN9GAX6_9CAEN
MALMAASTSSSSPSTKLPLSVYKYSSYSYSYVPENVLNDNPSDQSSRWSSDSNNPPQYLMLKLERPAIVESIKFGKYEKTHVCNLKKFKVYGGLTEDHLIEILDSGLKNDHIPESFPVRNTIDGNNFPCRYVKIMPIQAWGPSFNFSIWSVELHGVDDWHRVKACMNWYNTYREREAIRLCLKHFRQRHYMEAFQELSKKTKVSLEHPLLTELHDSLVLRGEYEKCEDVVRRACQEGLFDQYISQQDYKPIWTPIQPVSNNKEPHSDTRPGMRGGHQMCIDVNSETIYLFGGWDGNVDLADFWAYHVPTHEWSCLSKNAEEDGGPSARSCHKMCLDPERKQIFALGRYLDPSMRSATILKCDFYMYDIMSERWTLITDDTHSMGGPQLIFDHQMAIDTDQQTIYIFGGRVLASPTEAERNNQDQQFSGLFSFHVPTNTWTKLLDDCAQLRSRIGHSMLFHPVKRVLYIFAGQRAKEYLNDFLAYHVDTGTIEVVSDGTNKESCQAGFTQRATIDPDLNEIHVLSGLSRDKDKRDNVKNSFWVYEINRDKWSCIYKNENTGQQYWIKMQHIEPVPRFAHQLVYDHKRKKHYLFGGNPGKDSLPKMRLDDFWSLQLLRPSQKFLLRKCCFLIRKYHFLELACSDSCAAMSFLQTQVYGTIDKEDKEECEEFQLLTTNLFKAYAAGDTSLMEGETPEYFSQRTELFDKLASFFPETMTQPKGNLIDMIPIDG